MNRTIGITIKLKETCDDILAECNLIGKNLGEKATDELEGDIKNPDNPETRSIICRAHTEAFGNIKLVCRKYLLRGRLTDDNTLERIIASVTPGAQEGDDPTVVYEEVDFDLSIPNFDTSVTDALKNHMHKYIVDYVMWRFLQHQADAKCAEYKKLAEEEDLPNISQDLTCRDNFIRRKIHIF